MTTTADSSGPAAGAPLRIGLWTAQIIVFVLFTLFGSMKLLMPVDKLAEMWIWPGQVPSWFLHLTGILDVVGGIGVLLPAVTRIQPRLAVLAALGCSCCRSRQSSSICLAVKPPLCRSTSSFLLSPCSFFGDVGDQHPLRLVAETREPPDATQFFSVSSFQRNPDVRHLRRAGAPVRFRSGPVP